MTWYRIIFDLVKQNRSDLQGQSFLYAPGYKLIPAFLGNFWRSSFCLWTVNCTWYMCTGRKNRDLLNNLPPIVSFKESLPNPPPPPPPPPIVSTKQSPRFLEGGRLLTSLLCFWIYLTISSLSRKGGGGDSLVGTIGGGGDC